MNFKFLKPKLVVFTLIGLFILLATAVSLQSTSHPNSAKALAPTAESQCFYPTGDSYVWQQQPNTNFGDEATVRLSRGDTGTNISAALFQFNLDAIPQGSTINSAKLHVYQDNAATPGAFVLAVVTQDWSESTLTWNNLPATTGIYDQISPDTTAGYKQWDAVQLVHEWIQGIRPNQGLAIEVGGLLPSPTYFRSREATLHTRPKLCVVWTDADIDTDLSVDGLEITQGIQDLNSSVRLVAGKRTFVRFHAHSSNGRYRTFASLFVSRDGNGRLLYPINPGAGHIIIEPSPDRADGQDSFLFELPSYYTEGTVSLAATLNPSLSWREGVYPPENNYNNNLINETISFETVPQLNLIMYRGTYSLNNNGVATTYNTPLTDVYKTREWLQAAYPISDIWVVDRQHDFGLAQINNPITRTLTSPNADRVNTWLKSKRKWDLCHQPWDDMIVGDEKDILYYGMLTNAGGFMRGKASGNNVSSGPTGPAARWDTDGTFGNEYAGHEIGHTLDRAHVAGPAGGASGSCGGEAGTDDNYPHTNGRISTAQSGSNAFYGFNIHTRDIYDTSWNDIMSYCSPGWISDYTYEGIMDYLQDNFATSAVPPRAPQTVDRLLVMGTIDPTTTDVWLQPLFVIPDAPDNEPSTPGDYAIALRDAGGNLLARYSFTPDSTHPGKANPLDLPQPDPVSLLISEFVPYIVGTAQVDIEGPDGLLHSMAAGTAVPNVTLLSPNGGEILAEDTIELNWNANDADGDTLFFNVQFSRDNGASWEMLAQNLSGNSTTINRDNIPTTSEGLFRIWVTDGIHTNSDVSDNPFSTSLRRPEVTLIAPQSGNVFAANQSVNLQVQTYSPNSGTLRDDQISWLSNRDGLLGNGEQLTVTDLSPGTHSISVFVDDGTATNSDGMTNVIIVEDPTLLPTQPNALTVSQTAIFLYPNEGVDTAVFTIDNPGGTNSINWQASTTESWFQLDQLVGSTPATVTLTLTETDLSPGTHTAEIELTSPDNPDALVTIQLVVQQPYPALPPQPTQHINFLPLIVH